MRYKCPVMAAEKKCLAALNPKFSGDWLWLYAVRVVLYDDSDVIGGFDIRAGARVAVDWIYDDAATLRKKNKPVRDLPTRDWMENAIYDHLGGQRLATTGFTLP